MSWGEFVHVEAWFFKTGQHPWTEQDWYENTQPPTNNLHDMILWSDADRLPPTDPGWWRELGHLWSVDTIRFDGDQKLTHDVVRFHFYPLRTGASEDNMLPGLIHYELEHNSIYEVMLPERDAIMSICEQARAKKPDAVWFGVLTLWSCESGFSYVPGEPSEYDSNWQLIGVVHAEKNGVKYTAIEED
jgi:hypothetical protein